MIGQQHELAEVTRDRMMAAAMTGHHSPGVGDELLPAANMVFDHRALINATAERIWPWLVQLGKGRAGWYLPASVERMIPERRRAARVVDPRFQALTVGDRIPDYGGRHEWLEVARLQPPHVLVYRTERRGRPFTWTLMLNPTRPGETELRLRFRGQIRSQGLLRHLILTAGGLLDWLTGALMVRGLRQRLAQSDSR